ncbi:MAG: WD40 repeat domain-containing protein [Planctomycetales bacterium]|nr:WD40 repeat domain-containing protein [Planctomycetales bacterium]
MNTPAKLSIVAGETSATINIVVNDDSIIESDETLNLLFSNFQAGGRDATFEWAQLGSSIDGEAAFDLSGHSVSVSGDGSTVAIGSPFNDSNGNNAGKTRLFRLVGTNWIQLGQDINGEAGGDESGWSVSLSRGGDAVAIGSSFTDGKGSETGQTRVFRFDGSSWIQVGEDIDGEVDRGHSGFSVSLSGDGTVLAIGTPGGGENASGQARVYSYDGDHWIQRGQDIDGTRNGDLSGWSVSLSDNGNTLAIGAPYHNSRTGQARVFQFDGTGWIQVGRDLDSFRMGDRAGWSVAISGDGTALAIGAPDGDGTAHVYRFDGSDWIQVGDDIGFGLPINADGNPVSLSGDGNTVVIGVPVTIPSAGYVRIYRYDGTDWIQLGQEITGEARFEGLGFSVSVSLDGNTVVIGIPYHGGSQHVGQTRVYRLQNVFAGTIFNDDSLLVEFSQPSGTDAESSGGDLPQLLVTGTIQLGHSVTIDVAVVGGTATEGAMTIPSQQP